MALALAAALWPGVPSAAEVVRVEIGHTGESLRAAPDQPKHYLMHEHALWERVHGLIAEVDRVLVRLHALEPETALTAPVHTPIDAELGELFQIALRCNPALRKPRSELAVLAARTRQAGADTDPRASLEVMELRTPFGPLSGTEGLGVALGLSKEFASFGKRGLRREVASYEEQLKELELAQLELDLLYELTDEYYDLFGMIARLRALDQNVELMSLLLQLGERRLSTGDTSQASVLSAQVQLSQMELMRVEMRRESDKARERIYGLLGRPADFDVSALRFDAPYPLPPALDWHIGELVDEALNRYPAYQRTRVMAEQQGLSLELARREYFPDYMLMGEYEVGVGMQDRVMLGVEIPLFTNKPNRQDAQLQEQYAEGSVIEDEAATIASEYTTRIRELQFELQMHGELVDLYRLGSLPQARLAFESNIGGFSAGMMDFADLIMAQQALLTQEEELEQNYIHILHTLTDLHVLTLGAFDPLPHLVAAQQPAAAVTAPVVVAPAAESGVARPEPPPATVGPPLLGIPEGESRPERPAAPVGPELAPPDAVRRLDNVLPRANITLPDGTTLSDDAELPDTEQETSDDHEPEGTADSPVRDQDFYRPFQPKGDRDG